MGKAAVAIIQTLTQVRVRGAVSTNHTWPHPRRYIRVRQSNLGTDGLSPSAQPEKVTQDWTIGQPRGLAHLWIDLPFLSESF
jgi:hypothetical protein